MEDAQDFHILAADTAGNNVRGAGYHQFARSLDTSCPTNSGIVLEAVNCLDDSLERGGGRRRIFALQVFSRFKQIG
jgi:hypothetical protein